MKFKSPEKKLQREKFFVHTARPGTQKVYFPRSECDFPIMTGEEKLIAAMIVMALRDVAASAAPSTSLINKWRGEEASRWIKNNSDEILSFRWCCETIGLDPDVIRSYLRRHGASRYRKLVGIEARQAG